MDWSVHTPSGPSGDGAGLLPGREADFRAGIERALEYLAATDCRQLHVMAGLLPAGADRARHLDQFVESIALAADLLRPIEANVLVEPINTKVDVPGYLIDGTALALDCIAKCGRSNVRLQYDVYHMQIMEGDLLRSIGRLMPHIGHIQIADNPGRHEPGTGEVNFDVLLPAISSLGYAGWIGCEYLPALTQTRASTGRGPIYESTHVRGTRSGSRFGGSCGTGRIAWGAMAELQQPSRRPTLFGAQADHRGEYRAAR